MARAGLVGRPLKRAEYQVVFATREAEKGWRDLCATTVNAMADAWDYLTKTPDASRLPHGQLKGRLATLMRDGRTHVRWQYELPGGLGSGIGSSRRRGRIAGVCCSNA